MVSESKMRPRPSQMSLESGLRGENETRQKLFWYHCNVRAQSLSVMQKREMRIENRRDRAESRIPPSLNRCQTTWPTVNVIGTWDRRPNSGINIAVLKHLTKTMFYGKHRTQPESSWSKGKLFGVLQTNSRSFHHTSGFQVDSKRI